MTTEDQSAASDASEQTAPQGEVEQSTSLADSLLNIAQAEGYDTGESPVAAPTATVDEPESEEPTEEQPDAIEHKTIEAQIEEAKAKGEKPAWYLRRIAEESEKRRTLKDELEARSNDYAQLRSENQALQQQLAQAQAPRPTPQAPLVDIYDEPSMQRVEQSYEKILEFALKNPDGATDVVVGKDKQGNPVKQDFSPDDVAELRVKADRALRKDIPMRRQFLAVRAQMDAQALEIYPEFKDVKNPMTQEAIAVLQKNPMLEQVLGPEILVWIGHALKGREAFLKSRASGSNGNGARTDSADRIVKAATQKIAPTQPKTRSSFERRSGADLAQLDKQLEESGDEETAEKWLAAKLSNRSAKGQVNPIGG